MRKLAITFGLVAMTLTTAACNTVQGLGEDISSVGRAGEDAID
ncbi:entericidin A/B family lipoprotein [Erythrobacter sp. W53]